MKDRFEALTYDLITGLMRCLPFGMVSGLGAFVVKLVGPMTSKRRIAETGLRTAFPAKSDGEIKALMKAQWDNLGRTFAEFPLTHRLRPFEAGSRISIKGQEHYAAINPQLSSQGISRIGRSWRQS